MAINCRCLAATAALVLIAPATRGQGVAFQPVVGALPNGPTLGVTPAVSIDRRYVRLGINPQFLAIEGFNSYLVPAAVGGGPGGPGALGGVGFRSVAGGQFLAGMDGVITPGTTPGYGGFTPGYGYGYGSGSGANSPAAEVAPQGLAAKPQGPPPTRPPASRTVKPKALKRPKTDRARHPASAAPPGNGSEAKGRP
jgi:hypothetical protein